MYTATMTKTQDAQPAGEYKPTAQDAEKEAADFRLLQCAPYVIRWKDGRTETITGRQLAKLQKLHTWKTDY